MAGYVGKSWSNNHNNCKNSDDKFMRNDAVKFLKKEFGISMLAKDLPDYVRSNEWHHASKFYNEVLWWDLDNLVEFGEENRNTNFKPKVVKVKKIKVEKEEILEGVGFWTEATWVRNRPKYIKIEEKGILNKTKGLFYYGKDKKKFANKGDFKFEAKK